MFTVGLIPTEMRGQLFPFLLTKTFSLAFLYQSSIFFFVSLRQSLSVPLCVIFFLFVLSKNRAKMLVFLSLRFFFVVQRAHERGWPSTIFFTSSESSSVLLSGALWGDVESEWEMVIFVFNELDSVLRWKEVTKLMSQSFTSK